ncbi:MAG: TonB-dependent receptor [Ignavibacteriae bacterium]|nr:MAG: TonB-dependent receptor [Ignavibacteriota bacterium]
MNSATDNPIMKYILILIAFLAITSEQTYSQTISGTVTDSSGMPLPDINVKIKGSYIGTASDNDGKYLLKGMNDGEYTIQVSSVGYKTVEYTGIKVRKNENTELNIKLNVASYNVDEEILVIGERPLLDIEQTESKHIISSEDIQGKIVENVIDVVTLQPGVIKQDDALFIRGGRSDDNSFLIDGISVQDPLAGTGFGLQLSSNVLEEVEVITGGYNAEFGQATSGVVNVKTKDGNYKNYGLNISYKKDNLGFNKNWKSTFNTDVLEVNFNGPEPVTKYLLKDLMKVKFPGEITFFANFFMNISDGFLSVPELYEGTISGFKAKQLNSSIFEGTRFAPRQNNNWYWLGKVTWKLKENMKIAYSYNQSVAINQNSQSLQTNLEYVEPDPGYQYNFQEILDNANTYTHLNIFNTISWEHAIGSKTLYELKFSKYFTQLRADANGLNWKDYIEPFDIVKPPFVYYQTGDTNNPYAIIPGDGFYDIGNSFTWHDHYVKEYRVKGDLSENFNPKNKLKAGFELAFQEMQLVDIYKPWIGVMGLNNDVYKVNPAFGSFYAQDKITFKGMILNFGLRFDYWFPGKVVDDAIKNPDAITIPQKIKDDYMNDTYSLFGRRWKGRISPRIGISHPVTDNQTLFFSYGHFSKRPKPQFVYAKIQNVNAKSSFQKFGNPNLNPETTVSYELGLRNQFTSNDVLTVTAYYKDIYDYVATVSAKISDPRFAGQSFITYVNQDYSKTRGIEIDYKKRIGKWFNGNINFTYSIATGKSSSSDQGYLVATGGAFETIGENFLSWDRPLQLSANANFFFEKGTGIFGFARNILDDISIKSRVFYQSGKRYTPQILVGYLSNGRPEYEADENNTLSKLAADWFWMDFSIDKYFKFSKFKLVLSVEITNLLNSNNSAIINPVTGKAYEFGDPTPNGYNDPLYPDVQAPLSPFPFNPARYLSPRQIRFGVSFQY